MSPAEEKAWEVVFEVLWYDKDRLDMDMNENYMAGELKRLGILPLAIRAYELRELEE